MSLLKWPCGCLGLKLHKPDAHLKGHVLLLQTCGPHHNPAAGMLAEPELYPRFKTMDPAQAKPADLGDVRALRHSLGVALSKAETYDQFKDIVKTMMDDGGG